MARRYSPEELLHLRQSPLCVKPKELPPLEEWMGQPVDDKTKRTQNNGRGLRDAPGQGNGTTTRPGALDFARHGRQASNGEFPIKALFSPGARDNKNLDSPSRATFGPLSPRGEQPTGMGRFMAGDREQGQLRGDRATTRFSALRASKDEGDSWLGSKTTRKQDGEEADWTLPRRGDREGENGRENGREHRRYGSEAENIRNKKDWRTGDKGGARLANRDWNNGQDEDPEWMAEPKPVPEGGKKTVQDFEAWKKAMKAQEAANKGEPVPTIEEEDTRPQASAPLKKPLEAPLALDAAEDKFFGLWGAPAPNPKDPLQMGAEPQQQQPTAPIKGAKSKFQNFFAAPEPPSYQPAPGRAPANQDKQPIVAASLPFFTAHRDSPNPPQSGPEHKAPASEDEQGFQRILDMLKAKSPNPAPQSNAAFQAPPRQRTPPREAISTSATPPLVSPRPKIHGVQQFLNPQSPGTNPDSQFLLNLMRAKDPEPQQAAQHSHYAGPHGPAAHGQQPHFTQPFERIPDERFHGDYPSGVDKLNPSAHLLNQRRHARFDSQAFDEPPNPHPGHHGPPPGFPGFPPGNFPPGLGPMGGQQGGFPGPRGPVGAPPGFGGPNGPIPGAQNGPFRGGSNFPPGFPIPAMGGLSLGNDHGPGPGPPPGFFPNQPGGPRGAFPPGFAERGPPMGMPMGDMLNDGRRGDQGLFGPRD